MNDLRYNLYGGARYPAPRGGRRPRRRHRRVDRPVGGAGPLDDRVAAVAHGRPRGPPRRSRQGPNIEVYRGTTSNQYEVGDYGS